MKHGISIAAALGGLATAALVQLGIEAKSAPADSLGVEMAAEWLVTTSYAIGEDRLEPSYNEDECYQLAMNRGLRANVLKAVCSYEPLTP